MPKPIIQDVLPPQRKSIRDIPIPNHRNHHDVVRVPIEKTNRDPSDFSSEVNDSGWKEPPTRSTVGALMGFVPKMPKMVWLVGGGVLIIAVFFLFSHIFSVSATVTTVSKSKKVTVDGSFTAKKDAKAGELQFEIMTVTRDGTKTVPSTGEKKVEVKASGTIVIYNDYNAEPQRLIKNTRFETTEGLIYRIDRAVTVPGKKTVAGKATPGTVEALVYADEAGETYNIDITDFTVPGFKGDPRYKKFYARSKTPMKGGMIGIVKTASPEDIAKASQELDLSLRTELLKEAGSQKPEGFVLYDSAVFIETNTISPLEGSDLKKRATLYGIIFDAKKLSRFLAQNLDPNYGGTDVLGSALDKLVFSPQSLDTKPWQKGSVTFALKGETTLISVFDAEQLKHDLVSQPKERVPMILKAYPAIDTAEVIVRPFWRSTLPDDPSLISVKQANGGGTGN